MNPTLRPLALFIAHVVFWLWNLLFVNMLLFGYGPIVLYEVVWGAVAGVVPWSIAIPALVFVVVPFPFMVVGLLRLRGDPGRLLSLFYGVQAPLMLLCLIRIFAVGPLSAPTIAAATLFTISAVGLLRTVLHGFEERAAWAQALRQVAGAVTLLVSGWTAVITAIYAVGVLGQVLRNAGMLLEMDPRAILLSLTTFAFLAMNLAMLALYPVAMVGVGVRSWQVVHRATVGRLGAPAAWALTAAAMVGAVGGVRWASYSEHAEVFAEVERALDANATDALRRVVVDDLERVREGLLSARTAPDRLFDADPLGEHVRDLYAELLPWGLEVAPQRLWVATMAPFHSSRCLAPAQRRGGGAGA